MKDLQYNIVREIYISEDDHILTFICNLGGQKSYITEGDCCSETWFADIIGVENLLEAMVEQIRENFEIHHPENDGRCRQEVDSIYSYTLRTKKGDCDIIFRNSSNGYYGGSIISLPVAQDVTRMIRITEDWQACGN